MCVQGDNYLTMFGWGWCCDGGIVCVQGDRYLTWFGWGWGCVGGRMCVQGDRYLTLFGWGWCCVGGRVCVFKGLDILPGLGGAGAVLGVECVCSGG